MMVTSFMVVFLIGHFSVIAETIIAFVADDDMVDDGDVQEFASRHDFLGQLAVVLAGTWVAGWVVVTQDDASGAMFQGVLEDDPRVGDDVGRSPVADAFHFQFVEALIEIHNKEMFLFHVVDMGKETFK